MDIKCESGADMQSLHQGETGAVGKTEIMVGEGLKQMPGLFYNFGCKIFDADKPTFPEIFSELYR